MFNCLEKRTSEYQISGRERREAYAKDAKKKIPKKIKKEFVINATHSIPNLTSIPVSFLSSSALFAQLSRLSRPEIRYSTLVLLLCLPTLSPAQNRYEGVGRTATTNEVKAWDIDVRPDFKGLPAGQGSVKQGEVLWEAQCASCHGSFGESNSVFTPLVGNTSPQDIAAGRVAALLPGTNTPGRTTLMKVSTLSTLWDYIHRAMPWTAPKSLTANEVYAVTAYMLNLGNIVPDDFSLSDKNIAEVQKKLPNRKGMSTAHALWPGTEFGGNTKPDVQGTACMANCPVEPKVASFLPDYARSAHGNLADQSRALGAARGAVTQVDVTPAVQPVNQAAGQKNSAQTASKNIAGNTPSNTAKAVAPLVTTSDVLPLLQQNACTACHGMDSKLVGPSFQEIAAKQGARVDALAYLGGKIKAGSVGVYGQIPMPAQSLSVQDAQKVAQWLAQGAAK
jgi:S-disulfanyl-L-cysteine oxidoreductase SoxD